MNVAVLGSGIMGSGIAQVCAMAGLPVSLYDIDENQIRKGLASIADSLKRFAKKNRLSEPIEQILERIKVSNDLRTAVEGVDLVIEAVTENLETKQNLFKEIENYVSENAILGTNTSQLSITAIASVVKNPERVIGIHFFNPAPIMKLIEIVRGLETADETVERVVKFSEKVNKETIICRKDRYGFITTRLILALRVEAMRILEEGIGTVEDIDKACRLAFNHPMGPFELNDFNGLDLSLMALQSMEKVYGERFKPPQILENMVKANRLGRKTGRGWYVYEK